jgi:type IV pilus assembly protein PilN
MIRINLLGVERKTRKTPAFDASQQVTLACSLILVLTVLGVGWWYWSLDQAGVQVEAEIQAAQSEQTRLQSLLTEVRDFEARRAQLQQRVQLIEQLRAGQSVPVQLLDHVSRSLPDMLWLTEMEQTPEALTIKGRSTTLIALSDFVGNLASTDLLVKPIEIVDSQVESLATGQQGAPPVDVIRFTVRAGIKPAQPPVVPAPATPARVGG